MENAFSRTELLLGENAMAKLSSARVAVFGIGGVGGYVCEALVRSGVGSFDLIDSDRVSITNLNRQIIATIQTIGRYKTEVMKERMESINPQVEVTLHNCFYLPENEAEFDFSSYDYVVDAVDTVTAKLSIVERCQKTGIPVISSMGAGNKVNPAEFEVADIFKTSMCPLAKVMRRELKKRNIHSCKVVYSKEKPLRTQLTEPEAVDTATNCATTSLPRAVPGSMAFVPSVAGLIIASEVVKDLTGIRNE